LTLNAEQQDYATKVQIQTAIAFTLVKYQATGDQ